MSLARLVRISNNLQIANLANVRRTPTFTLTNASRLLSALPSVAPAYNPYHDSHPTDSSWDLTQSTPIEPQPVPHLCIKQHTPHIIMSVSGRDRPGLAAKFVDTVWKHGAELSHSRMGVLGGDFALIARIGVDTKVDNVDGIRKAVEDALPGFSVSTRPCTSAPAPGRPRWRLVLIAPDRMGFAAAVAEALATCNANVHELDVGAFIHGTDRKFKMDGRIDVADHQLTNVMIALGNIEREWNAEVVVQPIVEWGNVGVLV